MTQHTQPLGQPMLPSTRQLESLELSRSCLRLATISLQQAREAAALTGSCNRYTLQLFEQLIENHQRMQEHMRYWWH